MLLPPRTGSAPLDIDTSGMRHIVIIGANGSGKTRFANRLAADLGHRTFRLSALKALYNRDSQDQSDTSIDSIYNRAVSGSSLLRPDLRGEFERLIGMMVNEEMLNLIQYKYSDEGAAHHLRTQLPPPTRLDRVMQQWHKVFPGNRVLVDSGRMLFSRDSDSDPYSPSKLSDGEKTVFYYLGAVTYAPKDAVILVESPEMFLHPSSTASLWNSIENSRPDCTFIYVTHDLQFASSRGEGCTIWVKDYDYDHGEWDYDLLTSAEGISDDVFLAILGARKPVLFIEGDGVNSIDARLYPLIFNDYTVKSLGGCDRVIESTRTFNSLRAFHNLNAYGIVDRDRRDEGEVTYLRKKQVFVPDVAEIENIFMLEPVIRTLASLNRRDPDEVFEKVRRNIIRLFETDLRQQALQHTRHRIKKGVEHRIDGRFANINQLEAHIRDLAEELNPLALYEQLCRDFRRYVKEGDYASILRVYNRKTMLSESHVARHCGLRHDDKDTYINTIINILAHNRIGSDTIRSAIRATFNLTDGTDSETAM
ncbi:MAG: DUF4435 domain-containing protein [Duncaniella sp.]|nr:DUF4435 domain-containing protein [Duncaniella sp.]